MPIGAVCDCDEVVLLAWAAVLIVLAGLIVFCLAQAFMAWVTRPWRKGEPPWWRRRF